MPITIYTPTTAAATPKVAPALVEIKRTWSDDWTFAPELIFKSGRVASGYDVDRATLARLYGETAYPWESGAWTSRAAWDLGAWWVRVQMLSSSGYQQAFIGRISGEGRNVLEKSQEWQCYGPQQILRKIHVSRSTWWDEDAEESVDLGWIPDMNRRDEAGQLVGNRSTAKHDGCYLFGGEETWSHRDMVEYLLATFADDSDDDGPAWSLGGQDDVLDDFTESVSFRKSETVYDLLRRLIPPRLGVDWCVRPTDEGFEVFVYTLTERDYSFAGSTLPRNPRVISFAAGVDKLNTGCRVARTGDHRYGSIRVFGRRAVICCSLFGLDVPGPEARLGTLTYGWDSTLETEYKAGDPFGDYADEHDEVRKSDYFETVYSHFIAAADWDFHGGEAAPTIDRHSAEIDAGTADDYQRVVRRTLSWLPLREGFDYTKNPPLDLTADGSEADLAPPAAYVLERGIDRDGTGTAVMNRYVPADAAGMSVSALRNEWGVKIGANPNHLLARDNFSGAADTLHEPRYNWDEMVVTIAIDSDQRLQMSYEVGTAADGVMDIEVSDAELWYLAAGTVVGCLGSSAEGKGLQYVAEGRTLRDDSDRLGQVLAGAVARYMTDRARAEIELQGFHPYSPMLGAILSAVVGTGSQQGVSAPISAVEWHEGSGEQPPRTVVKTGHAR